MERNQMKQKTDQHHSENTFQVGDMFFLHLQPYKQSSLKLKGHDKLPPEFCGPYKFLQKIGSVAYKLELPPSRVHPVFHVSCLKKVIGTNIISQIVLPDPDNEGSIVLESETILNRNTFRIHS